MSTPDLDTVGQIAEMVRRFYGDVDRDDLLGPVFNDVARVDWDDHLPKITAFWVRALLGLEGYTGNPFARHATVHSVAPLSTDHFARWLTLFEHTLDAGWVGPNTDRARTLARNVARVHASQLGVCDSLEDPVA
ncbi:MAG: group III truncated hemoglobin [Acidimicrobiales bacterium]|nr:group III truncated hemoglobin [Acidimicrobiales bacterium]